MWLNYHPFWSSKLLGHRTSEVVADVARLQVVADQFPNAGESSKISHGVSEDR